MDEWEQRVCESTERCLAKADEALFEGRETGDDFRKVPALMVFGHRTEIRSRKPAVAAKVTSPATRINIASHGIGEDKAIEAKEKRVAEILTKKK